MKILLDAMGGDNGPDANIKGAVRAINQIKAELILIGKEEVIKAKLKEFYGKTAEELEKNENVKRYIKQSIENEKALSFLIENAKVKKADAKKETKKAE